MVDILLICHTKISGPSGLYRVILKKRKKDHFAGVGGNFHPIKGPRVTQGKGLLVGVLGEMQEL